MNKIIFFSQFLCVAVSIAYAMEPCDMVVNKPIVNLRINPVEVSLATLKEAHTKDASCYQYAPHIFSKDNPDAETQLLFGEHVAVSGPEQDGWRKVLAIEQKMNERGAWIPCSGFVKAGSISKMERAPGTMLVVVQPWTWVYGDEDHRSEKLVNVSLGTTLTGTQKIDDQWIVSTPLGRGTISCADVYEVNQSIIEDEDTLRKNVIAAAKCFLGSPYLWGGCCSWLGYNKNPDPKLCDQISSVDCSGLVYLAHKTRGLLVPRNSHDQYLASEHIASGSDLRLGDLIFIARLKDGAPRVRHVIFYCGKDGEGEDLLLEVHGAREPFGCRLVAKRDYPLLGEKSLSMMHFGETTSCVFDGKTSEQIIYFGTFFAQHKLAEARSAFFEVRK